MTTMELAPERAIEILERTPAVLRSLLEGHDESWLTYDEGPGTWSPFDIAAHLIHCEEEDWVPRFKIMIEAGESRPFDPFDPEGFRTRYAALDIEERLARFERGRAINLEWLASQPLDAAQIALRGVHPEFGSVSFGEMLATWAVHDRTHIAQISRVMCRQYERAVGPWVKYFPIFPRRSQ